MAGRQRPHKGVFRDIWFRLEDFLRLEVWAVIWVLGPPRGILKTLKYPRYSKYTRIPGQGKGAIPMVSTFEILRCGASNIGFRVGVSLFRV